MQPASLQLPKRKLKKAFVGYYNVEKLLEPANTFPMTIVQKVILEQHVHDLCINFLQVLA
ncbi:hypothetical protein A3F06_00695 [candidate division TM6 bacterium RIFCSPHIGHO2_12_FULL_36_22]|nr:MAG: hypothetical protein A3F06_00695 [candidate division TM6 bacterium RIFCSPHIGHO2_12_FULL_36_22]